MTYLSKTAFVIPGITAEVFSKEAQVIFVHSGGTSLYEV